MKHYVSIHTHSEFSLLDGMSKVQDIVQKAIDNNTGVSCITDHGNMYNIADHFAYATKKDIKPIAGFEAYIVNNHLIKKQSKTEETDVNSVREHLILLAKTQKGYEAISKICSIGAMEGFYYRPRIDNKILEQAINEIGTGHIICTSACFLKDTEVLTKNGIKYIQDISNGEEVFSHKGNWQKVIKSFSLDYNDLIYTIQPFGNGLPISCTKDHKFLVVEKQCIDNYSQYTKQNIEMDNLSYIQKQRIQKNNRNFPIIWKEAQNLCKGDILLCPINNMVESKQNIDISFVNRPTNSHKAHKLKSYNLNITNELLEVLGLFVAEGHNSQTYIEFTFNITKTNLVQKVQKAMLNIFGLKCSITSMEKQHKITVNIYSIEVATLFENWCGKYAKNKKMPEFIRYLPPRQQLYFLKGCYLGDGYRGSNKTTYVTISKQLYYDLTNILIRNGINASGWISDEYIDKNNIHHCKSYYIGVDYPKYRDNLQKFIWEDNDFCDLLLSQKRVKDMSLLINGVHYCRLPIRNIATQQMNTKVYCLEVETDHSFVANNICVHNCIAGRIPRYILKDDMTNAIKWAKYYANLFKDDFYIEIQPTIDKQQVIVNQKLIEIADKLGLPLIATTDSHYTNKEDAQAHELLLALQSKTNWSNPNRWKFPGDTFYIMNEQQIINAFKQNGHEILNQDKVLDAIYNTGELADKCDVHLTTGKYYLPNIEIPTDDEKYNNAIKSHNLPNNLTSYLRYKCRQGLKNKIKHLSKEERKVYEDRLDYELEVIKNMKFEAYFLVVQDYIKFANDNKIPTGPARGCFTPDNKIHTNNGYKNINEVTLNDKVLGHDNQYHNVINVLNYMVDEVLNKFTINNKHITCTKDHLILAIKQKDYDKGIRTPIYYEADELEIGDYVCELN